MPNETGVFLDLQTETMKTDCFMGQKLGAGAG